MRKRLPERGRLAQFSSLLGLVKPRPDTLGVTYLLVLIAGCVVAILIGLQQRGERSLDGMMLLSLVLWQPFVEEALFRGVLQGELLRFESLAKRIAGVTSANVVVSIVFVAFHFINHAPVWALATFVPSLAFGFFRDRSGSVYPGLALHIVFNGGFFLAAN